MSNLVVHQSGGTEALSGPRGRSRGLKVCLFLSFTASERFSGKLTNCPTPSRCPTWKEGKTEKERERERERESERELYLSPSLIEWKIVAAVSPSLPPLCKVCSCLEASMYDVDKLLRFSHSIPIPLIVLIICKFGQFLGNQPLRRRHTCRHPFC